MNGNISAVRIRQMSVPIAGSLYLGGDLSNVAGRPRGVPGGILDERRLDTINSAYRNGWDCGISLATHNYIQGTPCLLSFLDVADS